jgi:MFS family permease
MLAPILPARLDQLHSSALMRGAIFGAYPFTVAVVSLFVPQLIDRFGRKPLLVLGLAAEGALVILFGNVRVERHGGNAAALWLYLSLRVLTVRAAAASKQGCWQMPRTPNPPPPGTPAFCASHPRHCVPRNLGLTPSPLGLPCPPPPPGRLRSCAEHRAAAVRDGRV